MFDSILSQYSVSLFSLLLIALGYFLPVAPKRENYIIFGGICGTFVCGIITLVSKFTSSYLFIFIIHLIAGLAVGLEVITKDAISNRMDLIKTCVGIVFGFTTFFINLKFFVGIHIIVHFSILFLVVHFVSKNGQAVKYLKSKNK